MPSPSLWGLEGVARCCVLATGLLAAPAFIWLLRVLKTGNGSGRSGHPVVDAGQPITAPPGSLLMGLGTLFLFLLLICFLFLLNTFFEK